MFEDDIDKRKWARTQKSYGPDWDAAIEFGIEGYALLDADPRSVEVLPAHGVIRDAGHLWPINRGWGVVEVQGPVEFLRDGFWRHRGRLWWAAPKSSLMRQRSTFSRAATRATPTARGTKAMCSFKSIGLLKSLAYSCTSARSGPSHLRNPAPDERFEVPVP